MSKQKTRIVWLARDAQSPAMYSVWAKRPPWHGRDREWNEGPALGTQGYMVGYLCSEHVHRVLGVSLEVATARRVRLSAEFVGSKVHRGK